MYKVNKTKYIGILKFKEKRKNRHWKESMRSDAAVRGRRLEEEEAGKNWTGREKCVLPRISTSVTKKILH